MEIIVIILIIILAPYVIATIGAIISGILDLFKNK